MPPYQEIEQNCDTKDQSSEIDQYFDEFQSSIQEKFQKMEMLIRSMQFAETEEVAAHSFGNIGNCATERLDEVNQELENSYENVEYIKNEIDDLHAKLKIFMADLLKFKNLSKIPVTWRILNKNITTKLQKLTACVDAFGEKHENLVKNYINEDIDYEFKRQRLNYEIGSLIYTYYELVAEFENLKLSFAGLNAEKKKLKIYNKENNTSNFQMNNEFLQGEQRLTQIANNLENWKVYRENKIKRKIEKNLFLQNILINKQIFEEKLMDLNAQMVTLQEQLEEEKKYNQDCQDENVKIDEFIRKIKKIHIQNSETMETLNEIPCELDINEIDDDTAQDLQVVDHTIKKRKLEENVKNKGQSKKIKLLEDANKKYLKIQQEIKNEEKIFENEIKKMVCIANEKLKILSGGVSSQRKQENELILKQEEDDDKKEKQLNVEINEQETLTEQQVIEDCESSIFQPGNLKRKLETISNDNENAAASSFCEFSQKSLSQNEKTLFPHSESKKPMLELLTSDDDFDLTQQNDFLHFHVESDNSATEQQK